jgi:plastocyanin
LISDKNISEKLLAFGLLVIFVAEIALASISDSSSDVSIAKNNLQVQAQEEKQQPDDNKNKVSIVPNSSSLDDKAYQPNPIEVEVGDTVIWTNDDDSLHTVTSGSVTDENMGEEFDSRFMSTGKTFEHKFTSEGEYPYFCIPHPNMVGKVVVS